MKNDIRYSEFLFLQALASRDQKFELVHINSAEQQQIVGLNQPTYLEMAVALAEDGCVEIEDHDLYLLIRRLRGEIAANFACPKGFHDFEWADPRLALHHRLIGSRSYHLRVTYRGLCRLEELRELLKRHRYLEPFGVLLDMRYFPADFAEALHRPPEVPVSVLRLDLDSFKIINDNFGHFAGDVVMKSYLEAVRDCLGSFGSAYRGRGDEVAALIVGREHNKTVEFAEKLRRSIECLDCKFNDSALPKVTASIGVATSPPERRERDMETLADERQSRAKKDGKNRVVSS